MSNQMVFKRYEIKYMITHEQKECLKRLSAEFMRADEHGKNTICNIYFDTPDYRLIRESIEKPLYKEKLRLRSYGTATPTTEVFAEIKKKYKSVVYKRRIELPERNAMGYLCRGESIPDSQIKREIDYFLHFYGDIEPRVHISYRREALYSRTDSNFRITFDDTVLYRTEALSLCEAPYGTPILNEGDVLLEVKTAGGMPMWLVRWLNENGIYKRSFSKYGTAYAMMLRNKETDGQGKDSVIYA